MSADAEQAVAAVATAAARVASAVRDEDDARAELAAALVAARSLTPPVRWAALAAAAGMTRQALHAAAAAHVRRADATAER